MAKTARSAVRWATMAVVVIVALVNAELMLDGVRWALSGLPQNDWSLFAALPVNPYDSVWFKWALPAAWLWAGVIGPLGFAAWTGLHFVALALVRDLRVIGLALVTYPFWHDVLSGNVMVFVFVAAWFAIRGNRAGIVAFCILAALVPRPLMLPILAWFLWRSTVARYAFGASALAVVLVAVLTGTLGPWLAHLAAASGPEMAAPWNLAPSRFVGLAWLAVAWPLAVLAFRRGWLGVASVLVSPYWIPYYLVMAGLRQVDPVDAVFPAVGRLGARLTVDAKEAG